MKTINVYEFNELSEKAQKHALEAFQYEDIISDNIQLDVIDKKHWLEEQGFRNPEIHYNLSRDQGSGACFTFNCVDLERLSERYPIIKDISPDCTICGFRNNHFYTHERSVTICAYHVDTAEVLKAEKIFQEVYFEIFSEICKDLQASYEFYESDEYKKDFIIGNDIHFFENGVEYHG